MTLLTSQLMKLRQDASSNMEIDMRKRVSVLYTPEEAAKLSLSVILELGQSGLAFLSEIDDKIVEYADDLFSPGSVELERSMLKPDDHKILTDKIRTFLIHLSPHYLIRAGQKCLEWLLARYNVAEVQYADLLFSMMPYHSTNLWTKVACQIKFQGNWRWLKNYKHEAIHRDVIVKELSLNIQLLSEFLNIFELAAVNEANPIVLFGISISNLLATKPKENILAVLVQSIMKGFQSDKVALRAHAITSIASLTIQTTSSALLDESLANKLLKIALQEDCPLNLQAFNAVSLVAHCSETDRLPSMFFTRAMQLIGSGAMLPKITKNSAKVFLHLLNQATPLALEGDVSAIAAVEYILYQQSALVDISTALEVVVASDAESKGDLLALFRRSCNSDLLPRIMEVLKIEDTRKLPAEVLIQHPDKKVREKALVKLEKIPENENLLRSFIDSEKETDLVVIAFGKIELSRRLVPFVCSQALRLKMPALLTMIASLDDLQNFERFKLLAFSMALGNEEDVAKALGASRVADCSFLEFDEIVKIMENDNLRAGLKAIAKCVAATEANQVDKVTRLLKLSQKQQKSFIIELFGIKLPVETTDKFAFFALSSPNLLGDFINEHLPKNVDFEVSSKVTAGRFFARLAFRHSEGVGPALMVVKLLECTDEYCSVIELLALLGMANSNESVRSLAFDIFEGIQQKRTSEDKVAKKIIKKKGEILSDGEQLKQVLGRIVEKQGAENWSLLHGQLSRFGLPKLLELCSHNLADYVVPAFIEKRALDTSYAYFTSLFALMKHMTTEISNKTSDAIDNALSSGLLSGQNISELINALAGKKFSSEVKHIALAKKILIVAHESAQSNQGISEAAAGFLRKLPAKVMKSIVSGCTKSRSKTTLIRAKKPKKDVPEFTPEFVLFVLERMSSFDKLENEINDIFEDSLGSEGNTENMIQTRVVGLSASTKFDKLRPELLVEVVRRCSARGNDDGNMLLVSALSLLSSMASKTPDKVLQSLMSVFTFMGAGLLPRADDRYSFHSIQETIKCVVPPLLKASGKRNQLGNILDVFCTALPHVPVHRQGAVFESLIIRCDPEKALWLTLVQLAVKHVKNYKGEEEDESVLDPSVYTELMNLLVKRFPVQTVLHAAVEILSFLRETGFGSSDELALKTNTKLTPQRVLQLNFYLVSFLNRLFGSMDFLHTQLAQITDVEQESIVQIYRILLEKSFSYTEAVQPRSGEKIFRALASKVNGIIEKILGLLPCVEFAQCVTGLLQNSLKTSTDWLTLQSLEVLCTRLRRSSADETETLIEAGILDHLTKVFEQESVTCINLAAKSAKLLAKLAGDHHIKKFKGLMPSLKKLLTSSDKCEIGIKDTAFGPVVLCCAVLVSKLKVQALGHLNWTIESIIAGITKADTDTLKIITVASLGKILSEMSGFVSPHLPMILTALSQFSLKNDSELERRVGICIKELGSFPSRVLLPEVANVYSKLESNSIVTLLAIVEKHIDNLEKGAAVRQQSVFQEFFLRALAFREEHPLVEDAAVSEIEAATCNAMVQLALRLPEASLRPFLFKTFNWAANEGGGAARLFPLYMLYAKLTEMMKSMFLIFTGSLTPHLVDILPKITDRKNAFTDSAPLKTELLRRMLQVLSLIFVNDTGEFLDESAINDLVPLLLDLLEHNELADYDSFCKNDLIPCISHAATAIGDDALWRPLNYRLLLKTRNENAEVRLAALDCLDNLVDKLGDDCQTLLQESAPQFFSELLEDDDERVEKKMQETIAKLEQVFGESVQSYFT